MIVLPYQVDDGLYLHFNTVHMKYTPVGQKALWTQRLVLPLLSLLAILIFFFAGAERTLILCETVVLGISSLIWVAVSEKIMTRALKRSIESMKKNGKLPFSHEGTVTLDETGLRDVSGDKETKVGFSQIERILSDREGLYIYFSAVQAFLIPAAAFRSEAERNQFLSVLNQYCPVPVERV